MNFRDLSQDQKNEFFFLFNSVYGSTIQQYTINNTKNLPFIYSFRYNALKEHQIKLFNIKKRGSGFLVVFSNNFFPHEWVFRVIKRKKKEKEFSYFIKPHVSSYYNKELPWQEITKEQFDLLNQIYNVTILPSYNKSFISVLVNIKNELI